VLGPRSEVVGVVGELEKAVPDRIVRGERGRERRMRGWGRELIEKEK
jgi:hypothetical protein